MSRRRPKCIVGIAGVVGDVMTRVASLGIVYASDAKVEPRVKVISTFPSDSHRTIVYPVAATVTAKPEADTYLSYLRSTAAIKAVFDKYGFIYFRRRLACL